MSAPAPRRRRTIGLLIASLAALACRPAAVDPAVLNAWLTCVECSDGELAAVVALAAVAPGTVDTLRSNLFQGPSSAQRGRLTQQLDEHYHRIAGYAPGGPAFYAPPLSQSQFVNRYLDNMVATYQGRAAHALGAIGGVRAGEALNDALQLPTGSFPPSVLSQIQYARDSLLGP